MVNRSKQPTTDAQITRRGVGAAVFALLMMLGAMSVTADEVRELDGAFGPGPSTTRAAHVDASPVRALQRLGAGEIHRLGPLSTDEVETLRGSRFLESSADRTRVGVVRTLPTTVGFSGMQQQGRVDTSMVLGGGRLERVSDSRLVWTAGFSSENAGALRLHLEGVLMPAGTLGFVYGPTGETHGPYALGGETPRDFWTNTVFADSVFIEIQFPSGEINLDDVRLSVSSIGHLEHEWFAPTPERTTTTGKTLPACFKDASCVDKSDLPEIENASRAVAQISYLDGSAVFVCSGGLLNTTAGQTIPYFLTANHCVNSAASAASVEAYWDYRTNACDGSSLSRSELARTLGSTLLSTGSIATGKADFTLLRLSEQPPPGRFYLGWSAEKNAVSGDTTLYRLSHPDGGPQSYSVHRVSSVPTPGACDGLPSTRFVYSKNVDGATRGGSSGSPLFMRDGVKVVGQLFGRCGRNLDDACDTDANSAVDGLFTTYFDQLKQWLAPSAVESCKPTAMNLCLTNGRFKVKVLARDLRTGRGAEGTAVPQNDVFGYFSLPELTGQSDNPEIFVKVVDGTGFNGKYWVFYGGLTDLEFTITVTDMKTGISRTYSKDAGGYCGNSDTSAF